MTGPVGRTGQGKTFLVRNLYSIVVLFYRQVDDLPPWAGKPKKVVEKYFKDSNSTQKTRQKQDCGRGLQKAPFPRCYGPQEAPQDVNHHWKGLGERSTTTHYVQRKTYNA